MIEAALDYLTRGWPIFPLRGKIPLTEHGLKNATGDPTQVEAWWRRWPSANIGLPTGPHFDVLDVDGTAGLDALAAFEEEGHKLPEGPTSATGNGYHLFFQPTGLGNRAKFAPGLDWRGVGGYVVAPPSVHPSGKVYRWLPSGPDARLNPVPAWLRQLLNPPPPEMKPAGSIHAPDVRSERLSPAYLKAVLERELEAILHAPVGARNDQLNRSAHAVFRFPELKTSQVADLFTAVALEIGLAPNEARRTVLSAWTAR